MPGLKKVSHHKKVLAFTDPVPVKGHKVGTELAKKREAREAIISFVNMNSGRLQEWLEEIYEEKGATEAVRMMLELVEYAVPKLSRVEHTGADEGPVEINITWQGGM
jgi:hypothetical protein